jgi:hypothetical protein
VRGLQASSTDEKEEQILSWLQKKNEKITRKIHVPARPRLAHPQARRLAVFLAQNSTTTALVVVSPSPARRPSAAATLLPCGRNGGAVSLPKGEQSEHQLAVAFTPLRRRRFSRSRCGDRREMRER